MERGGGVSMPLPWWCLIALALVGIEYTSKSSGGVFDLGDDMSEDHHHHEDAPRRALTASEPPPDGVPPVELPTIYINVPCAGFFGHNLLTPCGNMSVPEEGITFKTPFGERHIPGTRLLKPEVERATQALSHYTVYFCVGCLVIWALMTCCITSRRQKFVKQVKDTFAGKLEDDEEDEEDPPDEKEKAARLDPMSSDFIAPGNIYRLLGVMHPGLIGWVAWFQYGFKAIICAYMQLYLPYNVIKRVLHTWKLLGVKSPLWFAANATTFASMIAALGSLCTMFAGKCAKSIQDGAEANVHILTHYNPNHKEGGGEARGSAGYTSLLTRPQLPHWMITLNEYFWCTMSMTLNILMSLMLELAMFLQVATFTGQVSDVAITAVSLYFIFDLDDKVMEADPKLRLKYRRAVAKQTAQKDEHPKMIPVVASGAAALTKLCVPFGLLGIVLFAWKNPVTGKVIGGDGLTVT